MGDEDRLDGLVDDEFSESSGREEGKLYQDELYGAKVLSPFAVALMDSPEFQRLAGLKQLGFADLVYRGATHNRLQHSVGTYFISRTIMRRIVQNHERFGLSHPGKFLSETFAIVPRNAGLSDRRPSYQSRWRGVMEVVSAAALLHDLGHVPFGHTLEDEFAGIFPRHDRLAGHRLYQMLFHPDSDLARVFSDEHYPQRWIPGLDNQTVGRLIFVILNWKERVEPERVTFEDLVSSELGKPDLSDDQRSRLHHLQAWHEEFVHDRLFAPFMSDIIGNTICADLLDYLPRDRRNLGLEYRQHERLQRYFTIRRGTFHGKDEGYRLSIMVTRRGHGGQRLDVTTAVLNIMRDRYEMPQVVYYHHKKAAASAMLATLYEIAGDRAPRDNDNIYPAPWTLDPMRPAPEVPHVVHLSDAELIDYLGTKVQVPNAEQRSLQERLYRALRFRRRELYRTLLVFDADLAQEARGTTKGVDEFAREWRGGSGKPSSARRIEVQADLARAAHSTPGDVLIYCPDPNMQAKEIDARLEITPRRIVPLRITLDRFAYRQDVDLLQAYYEALWRAYIFVSPEIFDDAVRSRAVIDRLCRIYEIPSQIAYRKVRGHQEEAPPPPVAVRAVASADALIVRFLDGITIEMLPPSVPVRLATEARQDWPLEDLIRRGEDGAGRLSALLDANIIDHVLEIGKPKKLAVKTRARAKALAQRLRDGESWALAKNWVSGDQRGAKVSFAAYVDELLGVDEDPSGRSKGSPDDPA